MKGYLEDEKKWNMVWCCEGELKALCLHYYKEIERFTQIKLINKSLFIYFNYIFAMFFYY